MLTVIKPMHWLKRVSRPTITISTLTEFYGEIITTRTYQDRLLGPCAEISFVVDYRLGETAAIDFEQLATQRPIRRACLSISW
jgi:hypothetical protein